MNDYLFLVSIGIIIILLVLLTASKKYKEPKYRILKVPHIIDIEKIRLRDFFNL